MSAVTIEVNNDSIDSNDKKQPLLDSRSDEFDSRRPTVDYAVNLSLQDQSAPIYQAQAQQEEKQHQPKITKTSPSSSASSKASKTSAPSSSSSSAAASSSSSSSTHAPPNAITPKRLTWGRLMRQAKPERSLLIVATVFLFLGSILNMSVPAFIGSIIDVISAQSDYDFSQSSNWLTSTLAAKAGLNDSHKLLALLIFCLVILILLGSFFSMLRGWLFTLAGERVVARIRKRLFARVIRNEIAFFDVTRTGELINRLSSDTTTLKDAATVNLSMGLRESATVLFGIVYLLFISLKLTGVMLSVVPIVAVTGVIYGRKIRLLSKTIQEKLARATEIAEESFSQVRTVRAFYLEPKQISDYNAGVDETYRLGARAALMYGLFIGLITFFAGGSMILVMWYGSTLVLDGTMTAGVLTSFVLYTLTVGISLGGMAGLYTQLMSALGASERVFELLDRVPTIPVDGKAVRSGENNGDADDDDDELKGEVVEESVRRRVKNAGDYVKLQDDSSSSSSSSSSSVPSSSSLFRSTLRPSRVEGRVSLENVSFSYPARGDVQVLSNVNIDLMPGTVTALVGPSGSGKSTVVALIERFYDLSSDADTGRITVDGHDLRSLDPSWLHRTVALVSQEPVLFACTIYENLTMGRPEEFTKEQVHAAAAMANAAEFICTFPDQYDTMVGERGVRLSGGQRQRIAIARALLMNPAVLIADEATSALDAESEHHVQIALERLMRGRTTLVIAHRLSTVKNAHNIVVMHRGRVVESGTHSSLLALGSSGMYAKLVRRQLAGADADAVLDLDSMLTEDENKEK